jgi:hypothetical protein
MKMSKRLARLAAGILAASLLAGVLTGCVREIGGARCDFIVQNPHRSNTQPTHMDAKVSITCSAHVTVVRVEIKMQKRGPGGVWRDLPGASNFRETARLGAGAKFTVTTKSARCVPGTYRAAGRGSATFEGSQNASASWQYGNAAVVTCPRT